MSDLLRNNIQKSTYFKELTELRTFEEVVQEIMEHVKYTDPWVVGANGVPSSFFTCLYKLMLLRLTEKQVHWLIRPDVLYQGQHQMNSRNDPFVRAAGFLFIRFLSPPEQLWQRLYLFLMEEQVSTQFTYSADGRQITVGEFVRQLLADKNYLGTVLPRIPVLSNRDI